MCFLMFMLLLCHMSIDDNNNYLVNKYTKSVLMLNSLVTVGTPPCHEIQQKGVEVVIQPSIKFQISFIIAIPHFHHKHIGKNNAVRLEWCLSTMWSVRNGCLSWHKHKQSSTNSNFSRFCFGPFLIIKKARTCLITSLNTSPSVTAKARS